MVLKQLSLLSPFLYTHQSEWMAAGNCKNRKKEAKALQTVSFLSQKAFAYIKIPYFNSSWQGQNCKKQEKTEKIITLLHPLTFCR